MNRRLERVRSTLREAVQKVISRGLSDPRARGLITVTEVWVSDDLKNADIFISVLPEQHQDLTMHALRHAARHIRREAGELMALHQLPEFTFKLDTRLKQQAAVFEALAKAREVTPMNPPDGNESAEGEDGSDAAGEPGAPTDANDANGDGGAGDRT